MSHNRYLPTEFSSRCGAAAVGAAVRRRRCGSILSLAAGDATGDRLGADSVAGTRRRIAEPPITDLRTLVTEIADAIEPLLDRPYAIVGSQHGRLDRVRTRARVATARRAVPALLIVAASPAPHRREKQRVAAHVAGRGVRRGDESALRRHSAGGPGATESCCNCCCRRCARTWNCWKRTSTEKSRRWRPISSRSGGTEDRAVSATALAEWRRHTAAQTSRQRLSARRALFPVSSRRSASPRK